VHHDVRDVIGSECIGLQDLQSIIEIDTLALLMANLCMSKHCSGLLESPA
jgi:hypothetical protein